MCEATLSAFENLWKIGAVTSGSVMAPCSGFHRVAEWYRQNNEVDLGLHLTLTSEFEDYRWGPVGPMKNRPGLLDESGRYFHRDREGVYANAKASEVAREIEDQFEFVINAGLRVSHVDNHMYTCLQPNLLPELLRFSFNRNIAPMVSWTHLRQPGFPDSQYWIEQMQFKGYPIFDNILLIKQCLDIDEYKKRFVHELSNLPRGLSCLLLHPMVEDAQIRKTIPDWRYRVNEYLALMEIAPLEMARELGIQTIDFSTNLNRTQGN